MFSTPDFRDSELEPQLLLNNREGTTRNILRGLRKVTFTIRKYSQASPRPRSTWGRGQTHEAEAKADWARRNSRVCLQREGGTSGVCRFGGGEANLRIESTCTSCSSWLGVGLRSPIAAVHACICMASGINILFNFQIIIIIIELIRVTLSQ